jgi:hypothetical protein
MTISGSIQVFTVAKTTPTSRPRVVENGDYAPISLRVDPSATNAQVRVTLAALAAHFEKSR